MTAAGVVTELDGKFYLVIAPILAAREQLPEVIEYLDQAGAERGLRDAELLARTAVFA